MDVIPLEDFSHLVCLPNGVEVLFRELMGKDIYFIELYREAEDDDEFLSSPEFIHDLMERLSVHPYKLDLDQLTELPLGQYREVLTWFCENRVVNRVMSLNNWLTLCFHLGKQRWTSDLEWFESQPIVKIIQMSEIQADYHERVNKEMNKKK